MSIRDLEKAMGRAMQKEYEEKGKEQETPYNVFKSDYWQRDREVCVVDEIIFQPGGDVKITCRLAPKNERWIRSLAASHEFIVEKKGLYRDSLGPYVKFTVKKKKARRKEK